LTVSTADILVFKKASQGHVWANEGVTRKIKKTKRKPTGKKREGKKKRERKEKKGKKRNLESKFSDRNSRTLWGN
jgi:hypothetical protein